MILIGNVLLWMVTFGLLEWWRGRISSLFNSMLACFLVYAVFIEYADDVIYYVLLQCFSFDFYVG